MPDRCASQVPFKLRDEDIPDDWSCSQNIWDKEHASCSVPQALTDEEIDEILALQVTLPAPLMCVLCFSFHQTSTADPTQCCSRRQFMTWASCHCQRPTT